MNSIRRILFLAVGGMFAVNLGRADSKEKAWEQLPAAVQSTILAHGGTKGQTADKENRLRNGKVVYEAPVKDRDGNVADLVITEDGTLVETKTDDAADRELELAAAQAVKAETAPAVPRFSHPRDITNPYLPLAYLKQDILEGKEDGKPVRVERTVKPEVRKQFRLGGQTVETLAVEDRAFEDGQLAEVALDYFAQDDAGTVYYLGEKVDEYERGKIVNHEGTWLLGVDTQTPGVIFPAHPHVGDKFKSEDVSATIREDDEVVAVDETVTVPAGTYRHCVKVKERLADGEIEYKYYAPGLGVIREVPKAGDVVLISHAVAISVK